MLQATEMKLYDSLENNSLSADQKKLIIGMDFIFLAAVVGHIYF